MKNLRLVSSQRVPVPLPLSRNWTEKRSHNLGKALGEGLGLLKTSLSSYTGKFPQRRSYQIVK